MIGGLTVFGIVLLRGCFERKSHQPIHFLRAYIVVEYAHVFETLKPETLLCLNWFTSTCELSERWNIGNVFSHSTFKNSVGDFPDVVWFFFSYTLLKFDIFNANVSLYKKGNNFETEVKLNKAQHHFSKEVSVSQNIPADFQPHWKTCINELKMFILICSFILSRKRRKTFWYDKVLKIPSCCMIWWCTWQMWAWVSLQRQWLMTTWNKQTSTIACSLSFSLSSFNHSSRLKYDPWSLKAKALAHLTLNGLVSTNFHLFGFFKVFFASCSNITKKIQQEWKLACDETELTRPRTVRMHVSSFKWNITLQFALHMTTGIQF